MRASWVRILVRDNPSPSRVSVITGNRAELAAVRPVHPINRGALPYIGAPSPPPMVEGSIQVTGDIYGHLIPGANRQAVDRLDDATRCNPRATKTEAAIKQ
jgi:hypothetical protein